MTKTDLTVVAAILAAGLMAIESNHRIEVIAPAVAEVQPVDPCAAAQARYAANRMAFFSGGYVSGMRRPVPSDLPSECRL